MFMSSTSNIPPHFSSGIHFLASCKVENDLKSQHIVRQSAVRSKFSLVILTSRFEALGYFGRNLVILNRSQMTKTTPDLAPPLKTSATHQREDV
ncbi:hypothetical protein AVEN_129712-1 [Araneus ventricosus]|uniref:Uncharacterized protein n=1 Tax=Araneus ventricosus TaxID=182803 RepID=A0A4Y2DKK4_ARAVE|nr:hypothetical protein AVEN_129712-1 [Araneus ventricosus]